MIRIATLEDVPLIDELVKELLPQSIYKDILGESVSTDIIALYCNPEDKNRITLLIYDEDKPIGFVIFETMPTFGKFDMSRIVGFFIKKEYRKQGHASTVLDNFENWSKYMGCKYMLIGNSTGADLSKRGFVKYEELVIKEVK